jgi:hypothetical protein
MRVGLDTTGHVTRYRWFAQRAGAGAATTFGPARPPMLFRACVARPSPTLLESEEAPRAKLLMYRGAGRSRIGVRGFAGTGAREHHDSTWPPMTQYRHSQAIASQRIKLVPHPRAPAAAIPDSSAPLPVMFSPFSPHFGRSSRWRPPEVTSTHSSLLIDSAGRTHPEYFMNKETALHFRGVTDLTQTRQSVRIAGPRTGVTSPGTGKECRHA